MKVEELNTILDNQYSTPTVIAERYKFYSHTQGETETIAEYDSRTSEVIDSLRIQRFFGRRSKGQICLWNTYRGHTEKIINREEIDVAKGGRVSEEHGKGRHGKQKYGIGE